MAKSKAFSPEFKATFTALLYILTPVLSVITLFLALNIVSIYDGGFNLNELIKAKTYLLNSSLGFAFGSIG